MFLFSAVVSEGSKELFRLQCFATSSHSFDIYITHSVQPFFEMEMLLYLHWFLVRFYNVADGCNSSAYKFLLFSSSLSFSMLIFAQIPSLILYCLFFQVVICQGTYPLRCYQESTKHKVQFGSFIKGFSRFGLCQQKKLQCCSSEGFQQPSFVLSNEIICH